MRREKELMADLRSQNKLTLLSVEGMKQSFDGHDEVNAVKNQLASLLQGNLPDDVAYHLAQTLHGIEAAFCKKLPQACETTAANTVAAAPEVALIHPGVMKYFREIGVVK